MKKYLLIILFCECISVMAQNGITWTGGNNVANSTYSNMHPRMTLDRSGNPLIVWGRMVDESVLFTRWNGTAFTMPMKLNPSWLTVANASWMGPDIASHGDTVYVVVKRTPEAADTNRIFVFSSFDGGMSFNSPVEIGLIADSISRFPTVTTDSAGNPIVAFMKFDAMFGDSRWAVQKSSDYGNSFSTDVKASGWGSSSAVCDCCPGALIAAGQSYAMLYRDNNTNIRDIWTGISTDEGTTFTNGFSVDGNNWFITSCPSTGPDGVIIGDTIYSVFMNSGSGNARVYLSTTSITTGAQGYITNLGGNTPNLSQQNYPRIASDGKAMAIVWKQTVNGTSQLPVFFTNDIENGFPAAYDTVDLGDVTNADVALKNGNIFVVWEDDNSQTVKYRTGAYTQINTSISQINSSDFFVSPNPADQWLNVQSKIKDDFTISIFNLIGEKMYSENVMGNSRIKISNYPDGIYIVRIEKKNSVVTKKITVHH